MFSSVWYLVMQIKFYAIPPAVRYIWYLLTRAMRFMLYELHKHLVLQRESAGLTASNG